MLDEMSTKAAEGGVPNANELNQFVLAHIMDKVFKGSALDSVEVPQLRDMLRKESGRAQLCTILYDKKSKVSARSTCKIYFLILAYNEHPESRCI